MPSKKRCARLAPTFALLYGYDLYYPATEGPITNHVYGPVAAFAFLPATIFATPTPAILAGAVLQVTFIFGAMLAFVVRRSRDLVLREAGAARERANLARYFSPTVVDELAGRDEPLGPVRRQDVAVLFADLVGFTSLAAEAQPEEVMRMLRELHARMEAEVFAHRGTLEKFIGDALYATFGVHRGGGHDVPFPCDGARSRSLTPRSAP